MRAAGVCLGLEHRIERFHERLAIHGARFEVYQVRANLVVEPSQLLDALVKACFRVAGAGDFPAETFKG